MKKGLLIIALLFISLHLASAQEQTLGTFIKDSCIQLKQTCGNCTYVNITRVSAPDSSVLLSGNFGMTKVDTIYNYTFCSTSQIGQYIVDWKADPNAIQTAGNYDFYISLTGQIPTQAQSTIYTLLGALSIIFFGLSLYGAIKIKWKHPRNERGNIIGINDLKYVKLFLWFFSYLILIFITFAFRHVSRIADWDVGANWLNFMFWFLISALLPVFILTLVIGFVSFLESKRIAQLIKRGIRV